MEDQKNTLNQQLCSFKKFDERLTINHTSEPKSNDYTDLHIIVPEKAAITISIQKGDISISESNGIIAAYTDQGDIQINQGSNNHSKNYQRKYHCCSKRNVTRKKD